ncbi:cytochrome c biogenesis CcdA family protein [Desulfoscipio gibsoniae]|uniref:Cytochrome c biogenesis protein n=1 Tax=Desulfoscipio gibsoniae DSM 7213 TaxID=767817 RepID=R4KJJ9_9FIRM|nr:cytochrome c biogenesis CcdA family protein [Desulfoscipio gibsoniae]AGL00700.1 cytochrome c biogenesis protein [Desulfoscipio gibsoniae DSM 7213]
MNGLSSVSALTAFVFGGLSFLSPCVLPLLPGYLSFIAGTDITGAAAPSRRRAMWNSTGFVLGFSVLFVSLGAAASSAGQWLISNQTLLKQAAGIIIIIFGLHISEILPIKLFYRQVKWQPAQRFTGWLGAFFLGLSFAAGWTPCVGPVLASILLLATNTQTLYQGVTLLIWYSMGLAIPFLLAALGIGFVHSWLGKMNKVIPYINAVSGGLLIAMGVLLLLGLWDRLVLLLY